MKLPLEPTDEIIAKAKKFLLRKWIERFNERFPALARDYPSMVPTDLSDSCKFSSLFAQKLFGGVLRGSYHHQWLVSNGKKIDLNIDAADVKRIGDLAHRHDPKFMGNRHHQQSLDSCEPRVAQWVEEFLKEFSNGHMIDEAFEPDEIKADEYKPKRMKEPKVLYRSVSLAELEDIFYRGEIVGGQSRFNDFESRRWVFFGDEMTDQLIAQGEEIERQASHAMSKHRVHADFRRNAQLMTELGDFILNLLKMGKVEYEQDRDDSLRHGHDTYYFRKLAMVLPQHKMRKPYLDALEELHDLSDKQSELQNEYLDAVNNQRRGMIAMQKDWKASSAVIITKPITGGLHYSEAHGKTGFSTDEYGFKPGQVKDTDIETVIFIKDGQRVASCPAHAALHAVRKIMGTA